jgi:hypothetical protein
VFALRGSSFFTLNLFIGVVIDNFNRLKQVWSISLPAGVLISQASLLAPSGCGFAACVWAAVSAAAPALRPCDGVQRCRHSCPFRISNLASRLWPLPMRLICAPQEYDGSALMTEAQRQYQTTKKLVESMRLNATAQVRFSSLPCLGLVRLLASCCLVGFSVWLSFLLLLSDARCSSRWHAILGKLSHHTALFRSKDLPPRPNHNRLRGWCYDVISNSKVCVCFRYAATLSQLRRVASLPSNPSFIRTLALSEAHSELLLLICYCSSIR